MFCSHTIFEVGDDFKVRFLHDFWCADATLKKAFPILFDTNCIKDASFVTCGIFWRCHSMEHKLF
jgi:hypothetical protein